jgi:hypothetical protein
MSSHKELFGRDHSRFPADVFPVQARDSKFNITHPRMYRKDNRAWRTSFALIMPENQITDLRQLVASVATSQT